jgi:hypothetical protein
MQPFEDNDPERVPWWRRFVRMWNDLGFYRDIFTNVLVDDSRRVRGCRVPTGRALHGARRIGPVPAELSGRVPEITTHVVVAAR